MALSLSIQSIKEPVTYCEEQPESQRVQVTPVLKTQRMAQKQISHFLKTLLNIRGSVQMEVTETFRSAQTENIVIMGGSWVTDSS